MAPDRSVAQAAALQAAEIKYDNTLPLTLFTHRVVRKPCTDFEI
jgi:hypothetical protein